MRTTKQLIAILFCLLLSAPVMPAQDRPREAQANNPISQDVVIIIGQQQVRFNLQKAVQEARLQVFDQTGELVYDSGGTAELELIWPLRAANGEALKSGLYAYALSLKDIGAADAHVRRGHFIVDRAQDRDGQTDHLWVTSQSDNGVGAELTVARNEEGTVAGTSLPGERKGGNAGDKEPGTDPRAGSEQSTKNPVIAAANGMTGQIAKFTSATDLGNSVMVEQNGNIGIGIAPQQRLHVDGNEILSTGGGAGFKFRNRGSSSSADDWVWYSQGNIARFWRAGVDLISVTPNGNVGIGTIPDADARLQANASIGNAVRGNSSASLNNAAGVVGYNSSSGWGVFGYSKTGFAGVFGSGGQNGVFGQTNNNLASGVYGTNDAGGVGVSGHSTIGTAIDGVSDSGTGVKGAGKFGVSGFGHTGGYGGYFKNVNAAPGNNEVALFVEGIGRMNVLQITGGSDFSENFDVNLPAISGAVARAKIEAGLVVSIDPTDPGKLALSTQAYDRRVAGIISGAGGVKPGMMMSQAGTLADGQHPVALSGRVYCWVDAARGAIEPGDLLTTSATAGHAMKVSDPAKAQGAIIGKAMTGLKEGKGLVLVLVTLQ